MMNKKRAMLAVELWERTHPLESGDTPVFRGVPLDQFTTDQHIRIFRFVAFKPAYAGAINGSLPTEKRTERVRMWLVLALVVTLLFFLFCMSGCHMFSNPPAPTPVPTSGGEAIMQIVQKMDWLVTLSILAVGAGFFSFLNGSGKGLKLVATAFVVLSLTLAVTRFSTLIAGLAAASASALLVYTIYIKSKAIKEIVSGNEQWKSGVTGLSEVSVALQAWKDCQKEKQSVTTEEIVNDYKN